jgi:hypothetical protein
VNFAVHGPREYESAGHSLVALMLASAQEVEPSALLRAYQRFLTALETYWTAELEAIVSHLLYFDAPRLPADAVEDLNHRLSRLGRGGSHR